MKKMVSGCFKKAGDFCDRYAPMLLMVGICLFQASKALAINAPAANTLAYPLYDFVVVQGLQGAPGFLAGVACVIGAGAAFVKNMWALCAGCLVGGGALIRADDIVETMGMII